MGQSEELVSGLAHCADDDNDAVPIAARADHVVGDGADPVGIGDRGAAVLLDNEIRRHGAHEGTSRYSSALVLGTQTANN